MRRKKCLNGVGEKKQRLNNETEINFDTFWEPMETKGFSLNELVNQLCYGVV